jgi:hypothetical protein
MSSTTTSQTGPTPSKKIKKTEDELNDEKVFFSFFLSFETNFCLKLKIIKNITIFLKRKKFFFCN